MKKNTDHKLVVESAEDLYENAPCGYCSILDDGTIIKANKTLLDWIDKSSEVVINKLSVQNLIGIGDRIYFETHVLPLLRMQGRVEEVRINLKSKNKKMVPVMASAVLKKHENVDVYRLTIFNITQRLRYERELLIEKDKAQKAANAKSDFLSYMSHEIRTPMNSIIGLIRLVQDTTLNKQQTEFIDRLKLSSDNLMSLLNNILDYSKIEDGSVSVVNERFNLKKLISNIVLSMDSVAHLNNTKLSYTLADEIPTMLKSDSFKIEQILTNFIGNALKFTRDGEIVVNTTLVEKKNKHLIVRFEVSDTGIGIAEDKLDQIFKKFTQENHEISKQYGGSGLGLSICSKLSEALNGTINVESIKGVGSKFSVEVPLEIEDDQTVEMKEVLLNSESNSLSGLNILVVEDSKENVYILDFLFKKWKINYEVAKDGESSIELAKKKKFDLILMDLSLPGIDGYTAAIEINKHNAKNGKTTPMIAFSASSNSSTEDKFKLSGFSDFIEKPFKPDSLYEKMENSVK